MCFSLVYGEGKDLLKIVESLDLGWSSIFNSPIKKDTQKIRKKIDKL